MSLTGKLGIVADCWPDSNGKPKFERLKSAHRELFEIIRNSRSFPTKRGVRLLDIGSGNEGSDFVNRYGREFPHVNITYLDSKLLYSLEELDKPNKVCANATQMPFPDESFDIAYAGHIISSGVLTDHWHLKNESYQIAKEGHRVIKPGGLFVFTYCSGDDVETLINLYKIGFKELEHLQRIKWFNGAPTDIYAAKK
ncbi:class I SAM-dependent methyltransferase [Candidatus Woesearchaeota archaeon]|nr:class I SAM-dependent methyltransferase [Candidatus Woesearchaeota archaeon]